MRFASAFLNLLLSSTLVSALALESDALDADIEVATPPPKNTPKSSNPPARQNNPPGARQSVAPKPANQPARPNSPSPPRTNPIPPKANNPPPKAASPPPRKFPTTTNAFTKIKRSQATWDRWIASCHGRGKRDLDSNAHELADIIVVQDQGVGKNFGYATLRTENLKTCFGVVITGKNAVPNTSAFLWHSSGTTAMIEHGWKELIEEINKSGITELRAYLSVPADNQPNYSGWTSGAETMQQLNKDLIAGMQTALQSLGITEIRINRRSDVSFASTMTVSGMHPNHVVQVNGQGV
jgi:hypothetical protein